MRRRAADEPTDIVESRPALVGTNVSRPATTVLQCEISRNVDGCFGREVRGLQCGVVVERDLGDEVIGRRGAEHDGEERPGESTALKLATATAPGAAATAVAATANATATADPEAGIVCAGPGVTAAI